VPTWLQIALVSVTIAGCGHSEQTNVAEPPAAAGFVDAAGSGDLDSVRRALADGIDVDARGAHERTAVTAAALNEHDDVVRALVAAGADVDLQDDDRNNALLVCGITGNVAVLREVLRAEPDLRITNRYGGTALIPASERGHVDLVRELLRTEIAVDHVNSLGWTALLEAVMLGDGGARHREIVGLLLDAGADVNLADNDGVTPLAHARSRDYDAIAAALERAGAED
jgi:ankyrin repeat protein